MLKRSLALFSLGFLLLGQSALAESSDYHLKKLEIQARAFLAQLEIPDPPTTPTDESTTLNEQNPALDQRLDLVVEAPTWSEKLVREDINSLLSTSATLREKLEQKNSDEYLQAKVELESLARRLRVSTSPLELDPQQRASLQLMMLELDEASASVNNEREQIMAQQDNRRNRSRNSFNVGLNYGPWGGWGPYGFNSWGPGAYGPFYGGGFYNPYFRRGFSRRGYSRRRVCR